MADRNHTPGSRRVTRTELRDILGCRTTQGEAGKHLDGPDGAEQNSKCAKIRGPQSPSCEDHRDHLSPASGYRSGPIPEGRFGNAAASDRSGSPLPAQRYAMTIPTASRRHDYLPGSPHSEQPEGTRAE